MTDLLSIMFAIGISLVLSIMAIIFKNTVFSIVSGLGWALTAMYMFSLYATGDSDYGLFSWGLGMMAVVLCLGMFFQSWWVHRRKTEVIQGKGENFYADNDPDYKEFEEMYKARSNRKKMRGR